MSNFSPKAPSTSRHHAEWLSLVEVSGPFVSLPVLMRVFPQGLDPRNPEQAKALRAAYEEWQDNPTAPGKQRAWVQHVLTSVLGYPVNQITEGQTLPAGLEANMPEMGETLRPDFALIGPAGSDTAGPAQLLIASYIPEQKLDKPTVGKHWKATPATRMMELLHGSGVQLGLVTNGEHWILVYAPRGETTGYASWYASLWLDEPITLRAFHSLLGVRRFFGVADESTLSALLKESAYDQQEVTDQLGFQVREAVEVLVQSFDAIDKDSNRVLLKGVSPTTQYEAALTIMMRLVFLFSAEERGLLHLGKPLYDNNYAVSTLQEQLQEVADLYGEEVLERRTDAWARLLSSFRAVHGGVKHQDLLMQAYGGSLFDPDRYPFLEGRITGSLWRQTAAEPLSVNNRVVLHLLNSLQRLRIKPSAGGVAETRRVSFRALGVEQIGHVYEGLLDHTGVLAEETVLGIKGPRNKEAEIPLSKLESLLAQGQDKLVEFLKDVTGRSLSAIRKSLDDGGLLDEHKLLVSCGHNQALLTRLSPFARLIREDSFERPLVVRTGSVYVTAGTDRRSSGTHYTPPTLTEPIVQHTLEPMVYQGPADGWPRAQWTLKSPKDILDLKVCDMAMGSGAFLVQVCRYLAERLVEAWENEEKLHPGEVLITPNGKFSEGSPSERLVPAEAAERIAIARRVVADRCLYGVDINPMAVEMAKLSLWLITVDANRPFTFLDHAFKCGDSLLGITALEQLENFSLRPEGGKQQVFATLNLWRHIDEAKSKREALEAMPSDTPEQIVAKSALYAEAEAVVAKLSAAADVLVAVELKGAQGRRYEEERELAADNMMTYWAKGLPELKDYAQQWLGARRCFHWALAFPEIIQAGGFDAFVGNPPFVGGKKISGALGSDCRDLLGRCIANGVKGHADLSAYFFLRVGQLLKLTGIAGLIATNTIAQGDTREVGLEQLLLRGFHVIRAIPSLPWPGIAALEIAQVWLHHGGWNGGFLLENKRVHGITAALSSPGKTKGKPHKLMRNGEKCFNGSYVLGMGFVLTTDEVSALISKDPKNSECLFSYLNGEDLNSRPDQSPSRWVINFFDWPLNRTGNGIWLGADERKKKVWLQEGIVPSDYPYSVAADYPDLLKIVEAKVKPERTRKKPNGEYQLRSPLFIKWWIYGEKRPALYSTISQLPRVIAVAATSRTLAFTFSQNSGVYSHATYVFAYSDEQYLALLQSCFHDTWAREYASSMKGDLRYTPSDCFETFPFPEATTGLQAIGGRFYSKRQSIMQATDQGLTQVYNRYHNPEDISDDVTELRRISVEMDAAVAAAYGWQDLYLSHGFYETKQGIRYSIAETVRLEILDRLLALNHQQHAVEEAAKTAVPVTTFANNGRKPKDNSGQISLDM
jgi:hypothetical protein